MMIVRFYVPGIPQPGGSKRGFAMKSGRVAIVDANPRAKGWKEQVSSRASDFMQDAPPTREECILILKFQLPRPKAHYIASNPARGLKAAYKNVRPTNKPDATKLLRAAEDALRGIVYLDDSQCHSVISTKSYSETPGVDVTILCGPWQEITDAALDAATLPPKEVLDYVLSVQQPPLPGIYSLEEVA